MANWLRTLKIAEWFQAANEDRAKLRDLVVEIERQLRALEPLDGKWEELERTDLADEFGFFIESIDAEISSAEGADWDSLTSEFDELMERLYDWGDGSFRGQKVCWIDTFNHEVDAA